MGKDEPGLPQVTGSLPGDGASSVIQPPPIEGYQILGRLGTGGMGTVWRAVQLSTRRQVALKVLAPGLVAAEKAHLRFEREVELTARLEHPNIARIYESGLRHSVYYYAMELVEGLPLDDFIRVHGLTQQQMLDLMGRTCRAVQYAHQRGVIHRDLKPSNVLVTPDGEPHVLDFGLAKLFLTDDSNLTISVDGEVAGTPAYMSPEQAAGHHDRIDTRSDVYSLGVILFQALTGRLPHDTAGTRYEVLRRIAEDEVSRPRDVSRSVNREVEAVLLKALDREPNNRYPSAGLLADDIENYLRHEPVHAQRPTLGYFLRKRIRKHRRALAVSATIALVLALAAAAVAHLALRASRTQRVAALVRAFDERLESADWSQNNLESLEQLLAELGRLAPEQAESARAKLHLRFAQFIRESLRRPVLRPPDVAQIETALALLAQRAPRLVPPLREALEKRLRAWELVMELAKPFSNLRDAFDPAEVRAEAGAVVVRTARAGAGTVLTRAPCVGNVQLEATFDESWDTARQVGLWLSAGPAGGYSFVLSASPDPDEKEPGKGPADSVRSTRDAGGFLRLAIMRNGVKLRQAERPASSVPHAPLRLLASREDNQLAFQVNDLPVVVFQDIFPMGGAVAGVFGLEWPEAARLVTLRAYRQALPVVPSPLETGDDLCARAQFADALVRYRQQAIAAAETDFRQQARYKEGLCLAALGRPDEAGRVFEPLSAEPGAHWPVLAACQLWLLRLRANQLAEADAIFTTLSARYRFEEMAVLIPDDVRAHIVEAYCQAAAAVRVFQFDPNRLRNVERAVAVQDLLDESPLARFDARWSLIRAYQIAGRTEEAIGVARGLLRDRATSTLPRQLKALEEYSSMLRLTGSAEAALAELDQALFEQPGAYRKSSLCLLVERARIHAALKQWDQSEKDLDDFLRLPHGKETLCCHLLGAWLMSGFLREQRGDPEGAVNTWRRGFAETKDFLLLPLPAETRGSDQRLRYGADFLYAMELASLSGEVSDAQMDALISRGLADRLEPGPAAVIREVFRPSFPAARKMWLTPRGRQCARQIAFAELPFHEYARVSLLLFLVQVLRDGALAQAPSPEQETLMWKTAEDLYSDYTSGRLTLARTMQLALAWNGTTTLLGWAGAAPGLDPRLRGPVAYFLGHRYLRLGRPRDAAAFFKTALADAPADSTLRRLAQSEQERLERTKNQPNGKTER